MPLMNGYLFGLVMIVAVFNGVHVLGLSLLCLYWLFKTGRSHFSPILLSLCLLSYVAFAHAFNHPLNQYSCVKIVQHYETGGMLQYANQHFTTFQPLDKNIHHFCANFSFKPATTLNRSVIDPLSRYHQAKNIKGVVTFTNITNQRTSLFEIIKHSFNDSLFEKESDLFWMMNHSGVWMMSLISVLTSLLNLKMKRKHVDLCVHGITILFALLSFDPRTLRLLMISICRLLHLNPMYSRYLSLVMVLLVFPTSIVSLSFLFPFIMLLAQTMKLNRLRQAILMVALQMWVLGSWSLLMLFIYGLIGKIIWWVSLMTHFPFLSDLKHPFSRLLEMMNTTTRFYGGIQSSTFFFIVFLIGIFNHNKKYRLISTLLVLILLTRPMSFFPQVHFINVGQGHATLFQNNEAYLIDTGTSKHSIYLRHYLNHQGIHALSQLFITHDDQDHSGGVESLIKDRFIKDVYPHKTSYCQSHICIHSLLQSTYSNSNEDSAIYHIQFAGLKVLITGDAYHEQEKSLINMYHDLNTDVLLAGHHGSRTSSHPDFIAHIKPRLVIISAQQSMYGHPHSETLQTLTRFQLNMLELEKIGDLKIIILPWFNLLLSSEGGFAIMR